VISRDQLIKARIGILALAAQLKNVAQACRLAGMSRSQFYALKKAYDTSGEDALAPRIRRKPQMPNRTPAEVERQILLKTQERPMLSYVRLAHEFHLNGFTITPATVRYVWLRHGLSTRSDRLRWVRRGRAMLASERRVQPDRSQERYSASAISPAYRTSPPPDATSA
jgi:hypothetical protein